MSIIRSSSLSSIMLMWWRRYVCDLLTTQKIYKPSADTVSTDPRPRFRIAFVTPGTNESPACERKWVVIGRSLIFTTIKLECVTRYLTLRKIAIWLSKSCQKLDTFFKWNKSNRKRAITLRKISFFEILLFLSSFWV